MIHDPHAGVGPLVAGAPLADARWAMILVHGRGGTAEGMVPIARAVGAADAALIAPRASGGSWYPGRFLAPTAENEPWLSSALASMARGVGLALDAGITHDRIMLVGFSQGACLSLEFVARAATCESRRFGGVAALAGALIGADDEQHRVLAGSLDGTPVFLSVGDADEHIPEERVRRAANILAGAGAAIDVHVYPHVGHTIVGDQVQTMRGMAEAIRVVTGDSQSPLG